MFIKNNYGGINFIHLKNINYYSNNLLRIYSLIQFYFNLFKLLKYIEKPNIISLYSTIPFSNVVYKLAKQTKAKLILEVVDLWPEVFVSLGLISKSNPLLHLAYNAEKWIYKKSDNIVFSMEGGVDYIKEKKWDLNSGGKIDLNKIYHINNGVDLNDFNSFKKKFKINDTDLLEKKSFKIIYLGSIRLANGVNLILDVAKKLEKYYKIKFLIYGDGPEREKLSNRIKKEKINNVLLKEKWVDIKYVPFILSQSSLNLLNYKSNSIFRFGGSQSKLFQYMASGKPICSNVEMSYCLINRYNLGIAAKFNSVKEYSKAILKIYNLSESHYNQICQNNLNTAKNLTMNI